MVDGSSTAYWPGHNGTTATSLNISLHSMTSALNNISSVTVAEPPIDYVGQWFKGIAMTAVIITTILGNLIVMTAVWKFRALRTMNNCFIVSLAVADLLVGECCVRLLLGDVTNIPI